MKNTLYKIYDSYKESFQKNKSKKLIFVSLTLLFLIINGILNAQVTGILWQKPLGGSDREYFGSLLKTSDGGYLVSGYSYSSDGDVTGHHGSNSTYDYWVVKLNNAGSMLWQKSYGGSQYDKLISALNTPDGGYILAGSSNSNDGDVSGHHGMWDYWIVKIDSVGNMLWQKTYGGSDSEVLESIKLTSDGGYLLAGSSNSNDGDVSGNHSGVNDDYWAVKIDNNGNIQWQKSLGGSEIEILTCATLTSDGGYVLAGISYSNDGDVTGHHGSNTKEDYWVVKLNNTGNLQWQKSLGGSEVDSPLQIKQTADGGYIIGGDTYSSDGNVIGYHGSADCWIVKLSANGNLQWRKCLGGSSSESFRSIDQTPDGGYIIGAKASSPDGDVTGLHGVYDYWTVKLSANGNIQWQKALGGSIAEELSSVILAPDGGYILFGDNKSQDGDVSLNHGSRDGWIIKLNGNGNLLWEKSLGGTSFDLLRSVLINSDGSYLVGGFSDSNDGDVIGNHGDYDYWVAKLCNIPDMPINTSSTTTICNGSFATLSASGANSNLSWYSAAIGGNYLASGNSYTTPILTDTTTFYVQDSNSCSTSPRTAITVVVNQIPNLTTSIYNSTTLIATQSFAQYQWLNCSNNIIIPGATNQAYTATTNGNYAVIVSLNGCSDTSSCEQIYSVSLDDLNNESSQIQLYPNPSNGTFTLETSDLTNNNSQIIIYNQLGQAVYFKNNTQLKETIETGLPDGIYMIHIIADGKFNLQKIIINKS